MSQSTEGIRFGVRLVLVALIAAEIASTIALVIFIANHCNAN